jgi:hypothetical protein
MSTDEEIVYDFTTELQKNKRVSESTFNRAEQRFGKKGVVDMTGISGYYIFLAMQLKHGALRVFGRRSSPVTLPELMTYGWCSRGCLRLKAAFARAHVSDRIMDGGSRMMSCCTILRMNGFAE